MKAIYGLMFLLFFMYPCFSQDVIKEEVSVDWWVVPLFAVDQQGLSINDLKAGELVVTVNGRPVADFSLHKRAFTVSRQVLKKRRTPLPEKRKMIFFLFDLAVSSHDKLKLSKRVAVNIVGKASDSCQFTVFAIDPYAGLTYLAGPVSDKKEILGVIDKKVVPNANAKDVGSFVSTVFQHQQGGEKGLKFSKREMHFLVEEKSHLLKNLNRKFYNSFQSLYYALNAIRDNKFVYLFSEGISYFARAIIRHNREENRAFMQQTAGFLGRSGAVLFIINPASSYPWKLKYLSGEDPLRYLARESGGKYLEGQEAEMSRTIENLHRAYYEIAFPEDNTIPGSSRKLAVRCTRPGVSIHTMRSMEKRKSYEDMNEIEKEIFAVNLVNRNPFFSQALKVTDAVVKKRRIRKNREIFRIDLPDNWLHNELDLFQVYSESSQGETRIEKRVLIPRIKQFEIRFDNKERCDHYFVVYNRQKKCALVKGIEVSIPEIPESEKIPEIKAMTDKFRHTQELSGILPGAADYCEKLKQAGIHYYCLEKVVERLNMINPTQVGSFVDHGNNPAIDKRNMKDEERAYRSNLNKKRIFKYRFDYQIIQDKKGIREQRKLLSPQKEKDNSEAVKFRIKSFLTEKAVFSPVTLLARERQPLYEYRFLEYAKLNGIKCAVIETLPRSREDARFVYGQAWISLDDFSVLRIKANPRSIAGYGKLKQLAQNLQTRLFLSLEIWFGVSHRGIRYPDRVVLSEAYKGGPLIRKMGSKGWERLRTEYTYKNYKFFTVDTKVSAE